MKRLFTIFLIFSLSLFCLMACTASTSDSDDGDSNNGVYLKESYSEVIVIAGSGSSGSADGNGASASFNYPTGLAIDNDGNIIVADTTNHLIRKIDSDGNVTTIAGSGSSGSTDGNGTESSFYYPYGVAIDNDGNIIVADTYNDLIRKVDSDGDVTTIANTETSFGDSYGNITSDSFNRPFDVAIDNDGNIIVADTYIHLIRKIDSSEYVTNIAGTSGTTGSSNGNGASASFKYPRGVAVDNDDNIIIADATNHSIRKIDSNGDVTTIAGSGSSGSTDGNGTEASFKLPYGVAVDNDGNIIVADRNNHLIRIIYSNGEVTTIAGTSGVSGNTTGNIMVDENFSASFKYPRGVAIDSDGNIIVSDTHNHSIKMIR